MAPAPNNAGKHNDIPSVHDDSVSIYTSDDMNNLEHKTSNGVWRVKFWITKMGEWKMYSVPWPWEYEQSFYEEIKNQPPVNIEWSYLKN